MLLFFSLFLPEAQQNFLRGLGPQKILQLYYFIVLFFTQLTVGYFSIKHYCGEIFSSGM